MKRYILIETGDGGEEDRRAYATEAERDRATLEAIWFGGPSEDDKREAECYLSELRKKGVVWFEGDPSLRWETLPDAPASPSTTGSREKAWPEKVCNVCGQEVGWCRKGCTGPTPERLYFVTHKINDGRKSFLKHTVYEEKPANESVPYVPESLLSQARAEHAETIHKMALVHLATGSSDAYGQGLYNGMILAASFITNKDANPVSLKVFREMQNAANGRSSAGAEEGEER